MQLRVCVCVRVCSCVFVCVCVAKVLRDSFVDRKRFFRPLDSDPYQIWKERSRLVGGGRSPGWRGGTEESVGLEWRIACAHACTRKWIAVQFQPPRGNNMA